MKNSITYIKKFSLIEIALAIAILAVGITSILSLFPLGMQETRDSIGQNYSSETAQSLFAFITKETYNNWSIMDYIPTTKPSSKFTDSNWSYYFETDIWDENAHTLSSDEDGIYGLKVSTGDTNDFTGEALIWKSQLENIPEPGDLANYDEAAALYMEISWPVEKPYAKREKNYYYMELYNYNL
jgi:uncharacterized protein (TIGR02598 family)